MLEDIDGGFIRWGNKYMRSSRLNVVEREVNEWMGIDVESYLS